MISGSRQILGDWFVLAIVAVAGLLWVIAGNVLWRQDLGVYDALVARTAPPASDDIVIVAIDDESILRLGRFPWTRDTHSRVLDVLVGAGARTILYDVLFLEPGIGDEALAKSVKAAGPILPLAMEVPGRDGAEVTVVEPLPALRGPKVAIGQARVVPDRDGIIRSVYLVDGFGGRQWPHVAGIAACRSSKSACVRPVDGKGKGWIEERAFLIPFSASDHPFRSVPFSAVLDGGVPSEFFRNRIVLVGATAVGLSDIHATPLSPIRVPMPGVEVNANIVQALVEGRSIVSAPVWSCYFMALLPLSLLFIAFLFARPLGIFLSALLLVVLAAGATVLLWQSGIWLSPVAGGTGIGLSYLAWVARRFQVAATFMRDELKRFRLDEENQGESQLREARFPASEMGHLHEAISKSRDFQKFLRSTLNGLPDASFVTAQDGIILIQNAAAHDLLDEMEDRHFSAILASFPACQGLTNPSIEPEDSAFPEALTDAAGRVYDVRWSRIHDEVGSVIAWVLRLADVTDLHNATRQREEALQLLTHDMRSPQISILTLLDQHEDSTRDEVLHRIRNYAGRTLVLADGFVQLARAESTQLAIDEVNVSDVIFDAVDDLWPQADKNSIVINTDGCDQEVWVQADRLLLTRALINLIGNAIKFTGSETTIDCRVDVSVSNITISVCDRGPGVEEASVATLFNRFQPRAGVQSEGVGLGLAFVRSVAERHRGTMSYVPRSGGGACFNLTLPLPKQT